jgi:hypothetical protein
MDHIDGVDENYYDGQENDFPPVVPPLPLIHSPRAASAAVRAPIAFYNPAIHDLGHPADDMDLDWDPSGPEFSALQDEIHAAEQMAVEAGDAAAGVVPPHNFRPSIRGRHSRHQRSVNQPTPTRQSETQWSRLTRREQAAIRGFLRQIPCDVTHASELGMMRLINRFRSRRSGGAKRQQNKRSKTHKRRKQ